MAIDADFRNRLMDMADECATAAYRSDGKQRRGAKAHKAALDLEALQYALAVMRDEIRAKGLENITPVETPFTRYLERYVNGGQSPFKPSSEALR